MKVFRNQDEDFEEVYEDEEIDEIERIKARKKFRDLKPENRRRRKEPPKPWGKKERLLVLFIFIATILIATFLSLGSINWKVSGLPRIKIPSLNFWQEETIILGGDKNNPNRLEIEKSERAISSFKNLTDKLSGLYAFYVIKLDSGFIFGVNDKEKMEAASLMKLPVLAALYLESEKGTLNLETKYSLKNSDKKAGAGSLVSKPAGTLITYREMARLMGKESDNTAFGIIRNIVGETKIDEVMKKFGMTDSSLSDFETTPQDIGIFFEKLWQGKIISIKSRDEILNYLTGTIYENWLVAGIPNVRIAHKYGRELHVVNDAGIVFDDKPFVLVIMSDGVVEREADGIFPELAKVIYQETR
jgi:beta-lactamase class A